MLASKSLFPLAATLASIFDTANAYSLAFQYDSTNFFSYFDFYTGSDPTDGYVDYVAQSVAQYANLVYESNGQVYLGVDHTTYNPSGGRESVRLSSVQEWGQGVFIADIAHMPGGICGTWPAFWMFGPNWPNSGEIDIIEGVNAATTDTITLHTAAGCTVSNSNSQAGTTTLTSDCNTANANTGCGVSTTKTNNFGTGFNAIGGGVYAMQWAPSGIYVWYWPRGSVPSDVTANAINVASWGTPLATFTGSGCNFNTFFANQNIIFDTTFCGDWAGTVWSGGSCASLASTCNAYVANNPAAFTNAYWLINHVQVWQ